MLLKNTKYVNENFEIACGDIVAENGIITQLGETNYSLNSIDLSGKLVVPGLIDIHIHGCDGVDTSDACENSFQRMSKRLASKGITGFVPTLISSPQEQTIKTAMTLKGIKRCHGAKILGLRMEGPFLSLKRPGCHDPSLLRAPEITLANQTNEACDGMLKIIDVAPETQNAMSFIRMAVRKGYVVSIAHSDADYDTAFEAFKSGASNCTHLFNAMSGLSHRAPGVVGATLDSPEKPYAEIICDGIHVHPAAIRMAARLLSRDRLIFISDAMAASCMNDGFYSFGGRNIDVKNGVARTSDGTLAGSTVTVADCLKNAVNFGIPFMLALRAVTINPARLIGIDDKLGSIQVGKTANFTVLDQNLDVVMTIIDGKPFNRGIV